MTGEIAKRIVKGITDKIECNTADIDDWAEFWGFTREEYEEFLEMSIKALGQEPRKGHWICDGKGRSFADYHCSECGLKLALCGQDIKQRQDSGYSLFCGGCGADMREVEE